MENNFLMDANNVQYTNVIEAMLTVLMTTIPVIIIIFNQRSAIVIYKNNSNPFTDNYTDETRVNICLNILYAGTVYLFINYSNFETILGT